MSEAVADRPNTRDRILAAALDGFAERGVEATSLDSLGAELGIRKQTILYWFPSKEQLLIGVIDHAVEELGRIVSDAATGARPRRRNDPVHPVRRDRSGDDASNPPVSERQTPDAVGRSRRAVVAPRLADAIDPGEHVVAATLADRLTAVVDATFRLGSTRPQLLAVLREVTRLGPPAATHLATAVEPLVDTAASALGRTDDRAEVRAVLLAAGARVVGLATEADVRSDLGLAPDLAWLRRNRDDLLTTVLATLDRG